MSSVSTSKIPLLKRKKAVNNLKALMNSSSEQVNTESNKGAFHSFFSEELVAKNPFLYENLRDNIGKWIQNYFFYVIEGYIYFKCNHAQESKPISIDKRSLFAAKKPDIGWKLHISVAPDQIAKAWTIAASHGEPKARASSPW